MHGCRSAKARKILQLEGHASRLLAEYEGGLVGLAPSKHKAEQCADPRVKARTHGIAVPPTQPPPPPAGLRCPTCGCAIHAAPRSWEVVCSVCGEKRWPYRVTEPEAPYVCPRCQITSPEKREAARAAGKRSAESRRKARVR